LPLKKNTGTLQKTKERTFIMNTFCWVDIPVNNIDRAITFYSKILGKEIQKITHDGLDFALLPHENDNVSGCLVKMPDRKPSHNGTLAYLNVDGRIDNAIEATIQAGGKILHPKQAIGQYGVRAIIEDSEGNSIAFWSQS
jgi:predicted enzyme related to lactoylglutathione lyase